MATRKELRDHEKEVNYFFEFTKIQRHFFKDFIQQLKKVNDPRSQSYITYSPETILYIILLKNVAGLDSMRSMSKGFNKEECIENMKNVLHLDELEELPHYDTINNFLEKLEVEELENIRTYMIKQLLQKRCFDAYRLKGRYWGVIFDGTGLYSFDHKHCEHCLKKEYKNKETGETQTVYMHHVLEAKLVIGNMVYSMGSEFIENESEDVTKQDCELKAFHRLAKKLKQTYKRLPICVLGDSLYACESVFRRCEKNKWKYHLRFKEGRIKSIASEFHMMKTIEKSRQENGLFWVNDISYNERTVNLMEAKLENEDGHTKQFLFITDLKINEKNATELVAAGRSRWKIENQGFNQQKNKRYYIERTNSHHYRAMKNHYLLTQIADILMQLYENGSSVIKKVKKTIKEKSLDLFEAIRGRIVTDKDLAELDTPIQVRFT